MLEARGFNKQKCDLEAARSYSCCCQALVPIPVPKDLVPFKTKAIPKPKGQLELGLTIKSYGP